jgi:hypothetical protein
MTTRGLWLCCLLGALRPGLAWAQDVSGGLEVEARGSDGPLGPGARVLVECRGEPPVSRTATFDSDGRAVLQELPPGTCTVTVSSPDHDSVTLGAVELLAGAARALNVTLSAQPPPAPPQPMRGGQEPGALPTRTLEALVEAGLAAAGHGDARAGGGQAGLRYLLNGFDLTSQLGDGMGVPVPLALLAGLDLGGTRASQAWSAGAPVSARLLAGSNRGELDAFASYGLAPGAREAGARETMVGGSFLGPVLKDRLWCAAAVDQTWTDASVAVEGAPARSHATSPRLAANLTLQATSRLKLSLLLAGGAQSADADVASPARRARLFGLLAEALLGDELWATFRASASRQERTAVGTSDEVASLQAGGMLAWFTRFAGDHELRLGGELERVGDDFGRTGTVGHADGLRSLGFLEDQWRPTRMLTFTPGLAWVMGSFAAPGAPARRLVTRGASPHLGLAWDATHDGRTALRASAGSPIDAGSFALAEAAAQPGATPGGARVWELTAGAERELSRAFVLGANLVHRARAVRPGDPRPARYEAATVVARQSEGRLSFNVSYTRQSLPGAPHELTARLSGPLLHWLWGSALLGYGNRLGWARLFPGHVEPAPVIAEGEAGWLIDVRVRAGLAPLFGPSVQLFADVLNLGDDRSTVGHLAPDAAGGSARVAFPPLTVRVGLDWRL